MHHFLVADHKVRSGLHGSDPLIWYANFDVPELFHLQEIENEKSSGEEVSDKIASPSSKK